jgi:hypothetical protein
MPLDFILDLFGRGKVLAFDAFPFLLGPFLSQFLGPFGPSLPACLVKLRIAEKVCGLLDSSLCRYPEMAGDTLDDGLGVAN